VNTGTINNAGNSVVVANATLINGGTIHALTLTVGGTLEDLGGGGLVLYGDTPSGTRGLTIAAGGIFIPGGGGIGTTTVAPDTLSPNNFPGRVLFAAGSTNIFKVDPGLPANTLLDSGFMGFGPNQNAKAVNGGAIVITNVGLTPFSAGQTFTMFQFYLGGNILDCGLNTTNSYPIMQPRTPGPGLEWDLSSLIPKGVIGIRSVATAPTNLDFSTSITTVTGTNGISTNLLVAHLQWPTNYIGWGLQEQANNLNIGLSSNWTLVFESLWTNELYLTNVLTTNCTFYRMVSP
jgi:hypothetical protein